MAPGTPRTIHYHLTKRVLRRILAELPRETYTDLYSTLHQATQVSDDPFDILLAEPLAEQLLDWLEQSYRHHILELAKDEAADIVIAMVNLRTALQGIRLRRRNGPSSAPDSAASSR